MCTAGRFSTGTECLFCPAGKADTDMDSLSACEACPIGSFAPSGSTECTDCWSEGLYDHDRNPATPCSATMVCTQSCEPGTHDHDCFDTTPCVPCAQGEFGPGGVVPVGACVKCANGTVDHDLLGYTECTTCLRGTYSELGHFGNCTSCPAGRMGPFDGAQNLDGCEHCMLGQHSISGSITCTFCSAGSADHDSDPATACVGCSNGTYAGCGSTACVRCVPGEADSDHNPATPCTSCSPGYEWLTDPMTNISACAQCLVGRADFDLNSVTACEPCEAGGYCAAGSVTSMICTDEGLADDDLNSSTPCVTLGTSSVSADIVLDLDISEYDNDREGFEQSFIEDTARALGIDPSRITVDSVHGGSVVVEFTVIPDESGVSLDPTAVLILEDPSTVLAGGGVAGLSVGTPVSLEGCPQRCAVGFEDVDCDVNTACTVCEQGKYGTGGTAPGNLCQACEPGQYAMNGSQVTDCQGCAAGRADTDGNTWTPCQTCPAGTQTSRIDAENGTLLFSSLNATLCLPCSKGQADTDANASTACSECLEGTEAVDAAGTSCDMCSPGKYDHDARPATRCERCDSGQYQNQSQQTSCIKCAIGKAGNESGSGSELGCTDCAAGTWSYASGLNFCEECAEGQFRRGLLTAHGAPVDVACQPCNKQEYRCAFRGMEMPRAAAGYFFNDNNLAAMEIYRCQPFEACTAMCPASVLTAEANFLGSQADLSEEADSGGTASDDDVETDVPQYELCDGGVGQESCSAGYTGERCSDCEKFDPENLDSCSSGTSSRNSNGYYRLVITTTAIIVANQLHDVTVAVCVRACACLSAAYLCRTDTASPARAHFGLSKGWSLAS